MFHPIKTAPELSQAITSTYLINVVIAIVFVLIMVLAVNLIKYQTGKKDNSGWGPEGPQPGYKMV